MIDIEQYIPEQKEKLLEFLLNAPKMRCQPKMEVEQFVRRSLLLHRNLIERWGGLTFRSSPTVCDFEPSESVHLLDALLNKMHATVRDSGEVDDFTFDGWWNPNIIVEGHGAVYAGPRIFLYRTLPPEFGHRDLGEAVHRLDRYGSSYRLFLGSIAKYERALGGSRRVTQAIEFSAPIRIGQRLSVVIEEIITKKIEPHLPTYAAELRRFLQTIGEQIFSGKTNETAITLSVRPVDFVRIGHYGERGSCYANSGAWDSSKMYLAADMPDSFVGHVHRQGADKKSSSEIRGRFWGVAIKDRGAICTNFYLLSHVGVRPAVLKALAEGLGIKKPKLRWSGADDQKSKEYKEGQELVTKTLQHVSGGSMGVYVNPDWAIYTGSSGFRQGYSVRYMKEVWPHVSRMGAYSRNGAGPERVVEPEEEVPQLREALQNVIHVNDGAVNAFAMNVLQTVRVRPVANSVQRKEKAHKKLWPYPDFDFVEERKKITEVRYV